MPFIFHADAGSPPSGSDSPNFLIPSPFIQISKSFDTTDDGAIIGTTFNINIKGKLTAEKGSPNSSGHFWCTTGYPPDETIAPNSKLASIFTKQQALRTLFSGQNEGKKLDFTPWDGSPAMTCNPRIKRIDFEEGNWFNTCGYTLQLEADVLVGAFVPSGEDRGDPYVYKVSKASEEWNIESGDEYQRTFRLTHSLSAQGKRFYSASGTLDKRPWQNAKDFVLNNIGLGLKVDRMIATGVLNAGSLKAYNYMRSQHVNEVGGSFQVTETWLCYDCGSGYPALEDFTINVRTADNGITTTNVEGSLIGYEVRDNTTFGLISKRYDNATGVWNAVKSNLFGRCQTTSGLTLNPIPLSLTETHNINHGTVNYSREYSDRAIPSVSGAISEVITIQDSNPSDIFASIPVLGRALGPVLQSIGTVSARKRTIQMEIVLPASRIGFTAIAPNTNALLLGFVPIGSVVFLESDQESWSARNGRYSRNVSFTWES